MFSKACEYGIKAVIFLAGESAEGRLCNVKTISKAIDSPEAFTAKVLQILSREGFIESVKGVQGGFFIDAKKLKRVNLLDVVIAIDGDALMHRCVLGLHSCSETNPCPLHDQYKKIKQQLIYMLSHSRLNELAAGLEERITFLKN